MLGPVGGYAVHLMCTKLKVSIFTASSSVALTLLYCHESAVTTLILEMSDRQNDTFIQYNLPVKIRALLLIGL